MKKTIDFPAVWMECAQAAQPSASGIFVCPSRCLFVSLPFVCAACILSVLICICLTGGFSLLGSELQLRHPSTWLRTEPSSHRAWDSLYVIIFCPSAVKFQNKVLSPKPHPRHQRCSGPSLTTSVTFSFWSEVILLGSGSFVTDSTSLHPSHIKNMSLYSVLWLLFAPKLHSITASQTKASPQTLIQKRTHQHRPNIK